MKFSFVVIACNQKNSICDTIDSILKQDYVDFEVIYVDDGSTDGSADTVEQKYAADKRVHVLRHTESIRVYQRQILPCEEMNNTAQASIILAYAAILENEFAMKSAADWLRRAVSLAFEQYSCAEKEDFIREVIRKIEIPMRKRRVN